MSSKPTVIIGGGVIGTACAYYLAKAGHEVTIVDQGRFAGGCSHANCGYLSPSHVLPLAAPGAISGTMKAMMSRNSPFSIKPRISPALWSWLLKFSLRCREAPMMQAGAARHALLQSSKSLYRKLIEEEQLDCEWEEQGLLFVYRSAHHFEEYAKTNDLLVREFGVSATPYADQELTELEPALKPGLGGAWHYEGDSHLRPDKLLKSWRSKLESLNVKIIENCKLQTITSVGASAISIETSTGKISGSNFIIATGAWTPELNKILGTQIAIQPGKGYSITMPRPEVCPKIPMILEEHRVAVTPFQSGYRLGSTMEFAGYDTSINEKRIALLRSGAEHYLREPYCEPEQERWYGWRPMTVDGLPYIDRTSKWKNVLVAAGHNMLGLSMATATGKLVSELINDETPHIDPAPYRLKGR
ncbi:MAG: amino acid dehydrogenase [Blastopirellula sp.]|nr:MAG: amino acid dehydrogenase [Blastopirellula sp.]